MKSPVIAKPNMGQDQLVLRGVSPLWGLMIDILTRGCLMKNVYLRSALFSGAVMLLVTGQAIAGQQTSGAPCGGGYSDTYGSGSSTYSAECGTNAAKNSVAVVSNEVLKAATTQTVGLISDRVNNITRSVSRQMAAQKKAENVTLLDGLRTKKAEEERLRLAKLQRDQFLNGYEFEKFEGAAPQEAQVVSSATAENASTSASRARPILASGESSASERWLTPQSVESQSRTGTVSDVVALMSANSSTVMPGLSAKGVELNFDEDGGLAAGNAPAKWGIWLSGGYSHINYNRSDNNFDGRVWTGAAGIDYRVTQRLFIGLSGAWEDVSLDTKFNRGNFDGSGWTVAPYAALIIDEMFSADLTAGYSNLSYDMDRIDPGDNSTITGKTDGARYFGQLNLNADKNINNWRLGATLGTLYAWEKKDAFTESNSNKVLSHDARLGRASLGGRVGYLFANVFEPYAGAAYRYDFSDGNSPDSDDVLLKAGTRFYMGDVSVGSIEASAPVMRDHTNQWSVVGAIRLNF
ncbi:MAG: autotransporter domain-containing protein [Alphaproteobacteria bacterium]|nr:autotransporter domain-containing protein [Alphaproteobacteria bacterium]